MVIEPFLIIFRQTNRVDHIDSYRKVGRHRKVVDMSVRVDRQKEMLTGQKLGKRDILNLCEDQMC